MTIEAAVDLAQKVGIPTAILAAAVFLTWRLGARLLSALIESYQERIAALEADRDHFRDRSEASEDRTDGLCRELIDEARKRPRGVSES